MTLNRNSSPESKWKYHVFLSFRGEDTRFGFTDHLYAALLRKRIITFRDEEELARGELISKKLLHIIEESLCAIAIISQNYASSTWCLDELQKIVETKKSLGLEVFPVFYGVDPSDVRHQRGSFAEAFRKHEKKFVENKGKVQKWRDALKDVANLSGWGSSKNQHETKLIEEVVAEVWKKLEPKLPSLYDGLFAMDSKVDEICFRLRLGSGDVRFIGRDVRFLGIWGMGGTGKTILATVVLEKIRSQFDVSYFLADVREASKRGDKCLVHLQNKLLSHLKLKSMIIETSDQGKDSIRNLLYNKKVLLILDDVSTVNQLENLAGYREWFGPGSRIIVTTRDKHLLITHGVYFEMYEAKNLSGDESLQHVYEKPFNGYKPKEDYLEQSKNVVEYAGGLPLGLEVQDSSLCGRNISGITMVPTPGLQTQSLGDSLARHDASSLVVDSLSQDNRQAEDQEDNGDYSPSDEEREVTVDGRPLIMPTVKGFLPSGTASKAITKVIQSQFRQAWASWEQLIDEDRRRFFNHFKEKVAWRPEDGDQIERNFHLEASHRLSDMLRDAREAGERLEWIGDGVWDALCRHWASPTFRKKSGHANQNRASETDGSMHTEGSISNADHSIRKARELSRGVKLHKVFRWTHFRKGTSEFVDKRSRHPTEDYESRLSQGAFSPSTLADPLEEERLESRLWVKATNGKKKGRIYNAGDFSSNYRRGTPNIYTMQLRATNSHNHRSQEADEIAKLRQRFTTSEKQSRVMMETIQRMMTQQNELMQETRLLRESVLWVIPSDAHPTQ